MANQWACGHEDEGKNLNMSLRLGAHMPNHLACPAEKYSSPLVYRGAHQRLLVTFPPFPRYVLLLLRNSCCLPLVPRLSAVNPSSLPGPGTLSGLVSPLLAFLSDFYPLRVVSGWLCTWQCWSSPQQQRGRSPPPSSGKLGRLQLRQHRSRQLLLCSPQLFPHLVSDRRPP